MKWKPPQKPDGRILVSVDNPQYGMQTLMDIFDEINIIEVMERCISSIHPLYPEDDTNSWLIQRTNDYIAVQNFEMAVNLLRQLTLARVDSERTDEQEERIFELTLKIIHLTEEKYEFRESFSKALKILSVIIRNHPSLYESYGEGMSVMLKRFLKRYQEESISSKDYSALAGMLCIIAKVEDKSLVEDLKNLFQKEARGLVGFNLDYLDDHREYYNIVGRLAVTVCVLQKDER